MKIKRLKRYVCPLILCCLYICVHLNKVVPSTSGETPLPDICAFPPIVGFTGHLYLTLWGAEGSRGGIQPRPNGQTFSLPGHNNVNPPPPHLEEVFVNSFDCFDCQRAAKERYFTFHKDLVWWKQNIFFFFFLRVYEFYVVDKKEKKIFPYKMYLYVLDNVVLYTTEMELTPNWTVFPLFFREGYISESPKKDQPKVM